MSVLAGEGSHLILYGSATFSARTRTHEGYLARPDQAGAFPVAVVLGPITGGTKELCRQLARHGFAAVAMEGGKHRGDVGDLMRWISAPGTPWADPDRVAAVLAGSSDLEGQNLDEAIAFVLLDAPLDVAAAGRPVLGLYGAEGPPAVAARAATADLPASQVAFYAGAGEGFWSVASDEFHAQAAADALDRIVAFLGSVLGVPEAA